MNRRSIRQIISADHLAGVKLEMSIALGIFLLAGCHADPETLQALKNAAEQFQGNNADESLSATPKIHQVSLPDGDTKISENLSVFEPKFPERQDPFVFPDEARQGQAENPITSVKDIEVLGFSKVNELRVFVRTRSGVKSIRAGEKFDGIEVLQINEPAVELKVGNLVWTTTMFDHSRQQ